MGRAEHVGALCRQRTGQVRDEETRGEERYRRETRKLWRPTARDEHTTCPPPELSGHPSRLSATRETHGRAEAKHTLRASGTTRVAQQPHRHTAPPTERTLRANGTTRATQTEDTGGACTSTRLAGGRTHTARRGGEQTSCSSTPYSPTAEAYGLRGWALAHT